MGDNLKMQMKELNLKKLLPNPAIVIIAKRGSGKTFVCRSIIDALKDIPVGVIISRSEKLDSFYKEFFPDAFIYHEGCPHVFKKILARQVRIINKSKELARQGKKIDTRLLLLMDDCLSDSKEWSKDNAMREILFDGRHYHITYVLTMQAPLEIPPNLRSNFDYVILMHTDIVNDRIKLYKNFAGMFPNERIFTNFFNQLTNNHGAMVLKMRANSHDGLLDKVLYFKAEDKTPSLFGCSQFKQFHDKNYENNWLEHSISKQLEFNNLDPKIQKQVKIEKIDASGKVKAD